MLQRCVALIDFVSPKCGPVKVNGEGLRPTKDIQQLNWIGSCYKEIFAPKQKQMILNIPQQ